MFGRLKKLEERVRQLGNHTNDLQRTVNRLACSHINRDIGFWCNNSVTMEPTYKEECTHCGTTFGKTLNQEEADKVKIRLLQAEIKEIRNNG